MKAKRLFCSSVTILCSRPGLLLQKHTYTYPFFCCCFKNHVFAQNIDSGGTAVLTRKSKNQRTIGPVNAHPRSKIYTNTLV